MTKELAAFLAYLEHERNGQEARMHFQEALRLNPNSPQAEDIRRWILSNR